MADDSPRPARLPPLEILQAMERHAYASRAAAETAWAALGTPTRPQDLDACLRALQAGIQAAQAMNAILQEWLLEAARE